MTFGLRNSEVEQTEAYTFATYERQRDDLKTADYPLFGRNAIYPALALVEEAGEVAGKIKKHWRNEARALKQETRKKYIARTLTMPFHVPQDELDTIDVACMSGHSIILAKREEIIKEMGDVLWYLSAVCFEIGTDLETVARENIKKLSARAENGTVFGEGDNR